MRQIDLRRFDLNLLLVFEALMRERHVGRSGEALGLTQPAVSHALSRLRELLGDPLFVRHAAGVRPTPAAEALAKPVAAALLTLRTALGGAEPFDPSSVKRTIVVGASDHADLVVMPGFMGAIRRAAPGLDVHRRTISRDTVVRDLRRGDLDLAIGPLAFGSDAMTLTPLFEEELVLIARRGHPLVAADLTPATMASLDYLLVAPSGEPGGLVDDALRELGLSRRVAMTVPTFAAAPFVVGATDLVAVVAGRVARLLSRAAKVDLHPLPLAIPGWTVGVARSRERPPDPLLDWLTSLLPTLSF